MIKLISAPLRGLLRFPLVQLAIAIGLILWLQAAEDKSAPGRVFYGLEKLAGGEDPIASRWLRACRQFSIAS